MSALWSMVGAPAAGARRTRVLIVVAVAVLAPLLIVLALVPRSEDQAIPVAVVNLDVPIGLTTDSPVIAGKLLTENIVTADSGVDWTITDTTSATAGLDDGTYVAIVTIPADFSKSVATVSSESPVAATIAVQTSTAHGYAGGVIANALAARIPSGVSTAITTNYVSATLDSFAELHDQLGGVSEDVAKIAEGTDDASVGVGKIAGYSEGLSTGLAEMAEVLDLLPAGARDLGSLSADGAAGSAQLATSLGESSLRASELAVAQTITADALAELEATMRADPTAPVSTLIDTVSALQDEADGMASQLYGQGESLANDAGYAAVVAAADAVLADVSGPVASSLTALDEDVAGAAEASGLLTTEMEEVSAGLDTLGTDTSAVATGLGTVADDIPNYSAAEQKSIAAVVASPIGAEITSVAGPTTARSATLGAVVPVALWLGALATFLVVAPFSRTRLTTAVSAVRIATDSAMVAVAVGAVQAVLVWIAIVIVGIPASRLGVAFALTLIAAMAFALLHQALVALMGRAGLVVSVVALGLQLVASGIFAPNSSESALGILPLSIALQGAEALVGGSLHAVLSSAIGLAIWGVVSALVTVAAVSRARQSMLRGMLVATAT
ncbi:putative membrane protein [Microbacterium halimionae]|uniref:Putative membrane protein n=1 Tax=Microbacterium halimionae TaxID=1526413 RepID=A0A7W3PLX9_9MICO|nr:ABC transporter permease [Microbacterium halimionae]MBA8816417.1 putative membrane protein [Microbacterium halimionae]NII95397.1 putative membrane protein [Microbacterium halimionae]